MRGKYEIDMEVDFISDNLLEEESFGVDDCNNGTSNFEGERCGICMDIVIDRGVLDCCQHWFCFTCVDNWGSITNLCPLCQNEFQLITCVPVYDTIGSNNADDDMQSRDDDWCIEGKNNTLSFPSYYIDENAVVCLDGDGCKVRRMQGTIEEYSNFETSIACDSCDMWYHAFCVGFDPEGTCENSWFCPRCTVNLMPQKSDEIPVLRTSTQLGPENSTSQCSVEAALSRKVMVSVADAGETAVVVSLLEGNKGTGEQREKISSNLEVCKDPKVDTVELPIITGKEGPELPNVDATYHVSEPVAVAKDMAALEVNEETEEGKRNFSSSYNVSKDMKIDTSPFHSFASNHKLESPSESKFIVDHAMCTESVSSESGLDLRLDSSLSPSSSVNESKNKLTEDQEAADVQPKINSKEYASAAHETVLNRKKNVDGICGTKRKHRDWRVAEDGETKAKIVGRVLGKKVDVEGTNQLVCSKGQAGERASLDTKRSPSLSTGSKDRKSGGMSDKKNDGANILDIVHGTEHRHKQLGQANPSEMSSGKRKSKAGLRVKKIMRRPTEDKESSTLVQELRKEIRDAVRNKTSEELGENLFDPKLLAAFREAVTGQVADSKRSQPVDLKAKKSLLQKGKIRESLTKKIYGIGGRRRRAWNRDCEIEFWKYRCSKISKPEKIDTLKSVLDLLRKGSESKEMNQRHEKDAPSSILSRLYLADSSVFPRKNDIKPLSTLKAAGIPGENNEQTLTEKTRMPSLGNYSSKTRCTNVIPSETKIPSFSSEGTKHTVPLVKVEASLSKLHSNRCSEPQSTSTSGGSKSNLQKESTGRAGDIKTDRRKWAQQFLARKAAVTGKDAAQEQEDTAVLKGHHPFLAQLPIDLRPVLAISRHNKIPTSVRQAQLHRLTEHFLRKTNMPVNRRSAEIELAVTDAVNIEKEVADKSNSKLVYMNLCSQELQRRSDTTLSGRATSLDPNLTSEAPTDRSVEVTSNLSSSLEVDEALRNAGLLSDSPPNSPQHEMEETAEVDTSKRVEQEGPDNVFELDSQPELDIYGDFEYELEDDDFIGASALKISELQSEEPKLKLVFSTVDSGRPTDGQSSEDNVGPAVVEVLKGSSNLIESLTNTSVRTVVDGNTDGYDPQISSFDDGGEEFSLAECEELYGPDKEPFIKKFPESASIKPFELIIPKDLVPDDSGDNRSNQDRDTCAENLTFPAVAHHSSGGENEHSQSQKNVSVVSVKETQKMDIRKQTDSCKYVHKKVEAYIKEHIRPLCKSGVITVEQYKWAVGKTTDKIMKYHSKDKNANFLIKEGEKVKKLAEQYVEAAQQTE